MRYGSFNIDSPRITIPLTPATHTLNMDFKSLIVETVGSPPMHVINDFDSRRVRFSPIIQSKNNTSKRMDLYYLTKDDVLVKPVLITEKLRVPFDVKPYPGSDTLNLSLAVEESTNLFHNIRRLDGLVLSMVHHLQGPDKPIEAFEYAQSKALKPPKEDKYNPTIALKLLRDTKIQRIGTNDTLGPMQIEKGDAYVTLRISHVWFMGTGGFGLQLQALRVKWEPYTNPIEALGEWEPEKENLPPIKSQFSD